MTIITNRFLPTLRLLPESWLHRSTDLYLDEPSHPVTRWQFTQRLCMLNLSIIPETKLKLGNKLKHYNYCTYALCHFYKLRLCIMLHFLPFIQYKSVDPVHLGCQVYKFIKISNKLMYWFSLYRAYSCGLWPHIQGWFSNVKMYITLRGTVRRNIRWYFTHKIKLNISPPIPCSRPAH